MKKYIRVTGGIGNQMLQYAFMLALQQGDKDKIGLDTSSFLTERLGKKRLHNGFELERVFGIRTNVDLLSLLMSGALGAYGAKLFHKITGKHLKKTTRVVVEDLADIFSYRPTYVNLAAGYFEGYFFSERYYRGYEKVVRQAFTFPKLDEKNMAVVSSMNEKSVSVHVRRGDYVGNKGFALPSIYYPDAITKIKQLMPGAHFYVFSDDIAWCKNQFTTDDFTFVDHNHGSDSYRDMQLMSMCKHHVTANSTFSWWGAWLGQSEESITICPKVWNTAYPTEHPAPENWLRV